MKFGSVDIEQISAFLDNAKKFGVPLRVTITTDQGELSGFVSEFDRIKFMNSLPLKLVALDTEKKLK